MAVRQAWYRRDPRSSPIGLVALVLSIVSAGAFLRMVVRQLFSSRLLETPDRVSYFAIVGSGFALLACILSLAIEAAKLPALVGLLILMVGENLMFPMVVFWTPMLLGNWSWLLGIGWGLGLLIALGLLVFRVARVLFAAALPQATPRP